MELKIEVGKKYKLRGGNTARCVCTDMAGDFPVVMVVTDTKSKQELVVVTRNDGRVQRAQVGDHGYDVISEYKEPRTLYALFTPSGEYRMSATTPKLRDSYLKAYGNHTVVEFVEKM